VRRFRFAIPSLQLKSGVRFELRNVHSKAGTTWQVAFYFGNSKAIQSLALDTVLAQLLANSMTARLATRVASDLNGLERFIKIADIDNMQAVWTHRGPGGTRAFMILDKIDQVGAALIEAMSGHEDEAVSLIQAAIVDEYGDQASTLPGLAKLARNSRLILAGLLIGSAINPLLDVSTRLIAASRKRASRQS
jgi:DNA (cytosine-5)-methyltransferase 1